MAEGTVERLAREAIEVGEDITMDDVRAGVRAGLEYAAGRIGELYDAAQIDLYNRLRAASAEVAATSPVNPTGYPQSNRPATRAGFGFGLGGVGFGGFGPAISSTNIRESAEAAETLSNAMQKLARSAYDSRKPNPGNDDHEVARARIRSFLSSPQGERLLSRHRSR